MFFCQSFPFTFSTINLFLFIQPFIDPDSIRCIIRRHSCYRSIFIIICLLGAIIVGFALLYPFLVAEEFNYFFSFYLILIIGANSFVENMFSIKYKILLQADQKYYIQTIVTLIAYLLSNLFAIVLIVCGSGIHIVRLGTLLGLMTTPFFLKFYVDRHYTINWKQKEDNSAIKSRWDAFAQQLASIFNSNIATILITFLFPLKEVSVYTVYHMWF
ncbi:MAG: oligosaccharide flippase family protein [Clostridia bacterium]|nr:oligosaccharide flippase family protein [Clostridia bacterium]